MCVVFSVAFLTTNLWVTKGITKQAQENLASNITSVARLVANSEVVIDGLKGERSEIEIATYASEVESLTGTDFVVVLDMNLMRKSHPIESVIGGTFSNPEDAAAALEGEEYITYAEGVMGMGKRVFTPIWSEDGSQIGVVVVGVSIEAVNQAILSGRSIIYYSMLIGLSLGIMGATILGRHVKTILFNLEPFEIAKLLKEREAMLDSVKEGVIAVDRDLKVTLINGEVKKILNTNDMTPEIMEHYISEYLPYFQQVLNTGQEQLHIEEEIRQIPVIFNCVPITLEGKVVGALGTFQDKTELKRMGEELAGIQLYTDTLRAQSHEFMNKLHVLLGLVQLKDYDKLSMYIQQVVYQSEAEVNFIVDKIKSPVFAGFLLGKYCKAREENIEFVLTENSFLPEIQNTDLVHQLVEIVGNLINNGMEAVANAPQKKMTLFICYEENQIQIEVTDNGSGIERHIRESIFEKGFSTKGENRGLGLFMIQQTIRSLKGDLELYTIIGKGTTFKVSIPYTENE